MTPIGTAGAGRLRRPAFARLFGTATAGILSIFALVTLGLVALAVVAPLLGKSTGGLSWSLVPAGLLTLLWLRVVTAWTRFDGDGVHTRYLVHFDYPWSEMHTLTLQRLAVLASERTAGPPAVVVRMKGATQREDKLAPVLRCGRHRREFGTALAAAARAHGVRVVVGATGWDEQPDHVVENYDG